MLNKQGPNKIDYADYTWNPISGKCHHSCHYCYMNPIWKRFPNMAEPRMRLPKSLPKKPSRIFVGSSTDMWGDWVPQSWIDDVISFCLDYPQHTYLFLTKNPKRYGSISVLMEDNFWYGTTMDGSMRTDRNDLDLFQNTNQEAHRWVSFEPLLISPWHIEWDALDWIVIGADSSRGADRPPSEWAERLIKAAHLRQIPVWVKNNYRYSDVIKEIPHEFSA